MSPISDKDIDPEEAAGLWDARLRAPDCNDHDRIAHEEWKEADSDNAQAFEELQSVLTGLPSISSMPEIQSMRAAALSRIDEQLEEEARPRNWWNVGGAIAAGFVAIIASTLFILQSNTSPNQVELVTNELTPTFATAVGERTNIPLTDGTTATLNTDSKIDVQYSPTERAVHLVKGEAHFDVAHNPERPFVVYAGDYRITAVGTAFDVNAVGPTIDVTVTEGKVEVTRLRSDGTATSRSGAMLIAGQQFSAQPTGPAYRKKADLAKTTSWHKGNAVFDDLPLGLAAQEMNRYSLVKLTIKDPELASTRISGMFITGKQDSFVEALEAYFGVQSRRVSDAEILLEPAGE